MVDGTKGRLDQECSRQPKSQTSKHKPGRRTCSWTDVRSGSGGAIGRWMVRLAAQTTGICASDAGEILQAKEPGNEC